MGKNEFDLIVIGAGSGGLGAALGMLTLGFKVLLVDKKAGNFGGECVHTGCIPSKALIYAAGQIHQGRSAGRFGPQLQGEVDFKKVKHYIHEKQKSILAHENPDYLREQGMHIALGTASFISKNEIKVQDNTYKARNIVIATGSSPRSMKIEGAQDFPVFTNETVFDVEYIPRNFVFIGAGPVGIELGQAFSRLGSKVSFVVRGNCILEKEDPEISGVLLEKLKEEGIAFYFDAEVKEIKNADTAVVLQKNGDEKAIPADAIFLGLGRELNFEALHLDKAGIKTKNGKIILNEKLQTSNKNVFVAGDAADNLKFSHAAGMHNALIIKNFISPKKEKLSVAHFPWVTFTDPEVATFGLNEAKLKEKKKNYEKLEISLGEADKAVTNDFEYGRLILFVEKKRFFAGSAKILGGSMVAPHAGEITQELVLANVAGLTLSDLMEKIYAYPTAGNINKIIARKRIVKEIKPWMKKILVQWYRFKE